jgi:ATP-binding cassette, subfamily B, bacterial
MSEQPQTWLGSWRERMRTLRNVPPLLTLVWKSGPRVVCAATAGRVIGALVPIAALTVTKRILDGVQAHFSGHPLPPSFWYLVAAEFVLAMIGALVGRVTAYFDGQLADRFTRSMSLQIMHRASRLDLASYEDPAFYDRLERARIQGTDRIAMVQLIGNVIQQIVVAASLAAGIVWFSPWLLVLLVLAVVPAFLGESHFAFQGYSLSLRQTPVRRQLDYLRTLGASQESAKELKLLDLSGYLTQEYDGLARQLYEQNVRLARRRLWVGALLSLISTGAYYGAYAYVVYETVKGRLSWGSLQFLTGALAGASTNIQSIFAMLSNIADQSMFLTDLVEFLKMESKIASKPNALPAPQPIRKGFRFEDVSFCYPGSEHPVLNRFNLSIAPGERIALIGQNGQGKTTIVKLLTRLYDPTAGRILLDGVDLRDYSVEDLHRQIGVIFQDFVKYEMTARQNIATGRTGSAREAAIRSAAEKSGADEVIAGLPKGYDQLLGRRFEGGADLSGGEWQKLALARAYMRDAQILVLDEPTASLDARAEYEVFRSFAELTEGRMAVLISHRFSTVRMVDRIVVLENGKIAEEGSHDQLIALGGRYAELFELQAASYR